MQRSKRFISLAGWGCLVLAGGCQTMGGRGASTTGFSPSFGKNYAPTQSEPSVEDPGLAISAAASASKTENGDAVADEEEGATGRKRARWLPGSDKEPPRKALPVSSRTAAATDDDGLDL